MLGPEHNSEHEQVWLLGLFLYLCQIWQVLLFQCLGSWISCSLSDCYVL
jgi:hypothetical protein